jgi:large subunit ribosomal protein L25
MHAIVYGGEKAPVSLTLDHNQFLRHLAEEAFYAHILTLDVDGAKEQVVLKDLQRHPTSDMKIIHADFLRVDADHEVHMTVPLHFVNEDSAVGVKAGGALSHLMAEVEIACLPQNLPEFIEVDVAELAMDESIHLSELVLPEGVSLPALSHADEELAEGERSSYDQAVVNIHAPRGASADEGEAEAATEE